MGTIMPTVYVLVGVPGSGKSTWIKNQDWAQDCVVVSTDDFVEDYAKEVGSTYSEVFDDYMPTAVKLMADQVVQAREAGRDIGSVVEGLKNRIATAGERGSALPLKSTKSDKNDFMGAGMKKGGSVKGWGKARGARKAKIY
jgi:hypothetical protein